MAHRAPSAAPAWTRVHLPACEGSRSRPATTRMTLIALPPQGEGARAATSAMAPANVRTHPRQRTRAIGGQNQESPPVGSGHRCPATHAFGENWSSTDPAVSRFFPNPCSTPSQPPSPPNVPAQNPVPAVANGPQRIHPKKTGQRPIRSVSRFLLTSSLFHGALLSDGSRAGLAPTLTEDLRLRLFAKNVVRTRDRARRIDKKGAAKLPRSPG